MVKVSICIPAYEQPHNLAKCLESISIQTFKDFEVVITDDSKSNILMSIIDEFKHKFTIKYHKNTSPKGSPENWNESIKFATGKYIKILHHDDYFKSKSSLEKFVNLLDNNPNCKIAFCSSCHIDSNGNHVSSHLLSVRNMNLITREPRNLFFGNVLGAPSIMIYDRSLDLLFDRRMKWLVDIDFYIRILENNKFVYTQEELVSINIGEEERVTYACQNNKCVNIYEHLLLFEKFEFKEIPIRYKIYFIKLFLIFDISEYSQIKKCGYSKNINISILFFIVKILRPIYRTLKKVKKIAK